MPEPRHAAPAKEPEPELEPDLDSGPSTSPFFTPAALRTEPVPPASRTDYDSIPEVPVVSASAAPPAPSVLPTRNALRRNSAPNGTSGNGTAGNGVAGNGSAKQDTHAGLPRRVRQANIAPQLRERAPLSAPTADEPAEERSPEEARAMFSAFQRGAQRGREAADQQEDRTYGEKGDE